MALRVEHVDRLVHDRPVRTGGHDHVVHHGSDGLAGLVDDHLDVDFLTDLDTGQVYLGCRFNVAPPEVVRALANYAEVISANVYNYSPEIGRYGITDKPVLISEYHFVNIGSGCLGGGLRSAQDAVQQGRQLSAYIRDAVDNPKVIGAHWFQWRDQNVGGRYDGENYSAGFFDVADVPNEPLIRAAAESGRTLYDGIN